MKKFSLALAVFFTVFIAAPMFAAVPEVSSAITSVSQQEEVASKITSVEISAKDMIVEETAPTEPVLVVVKYAIEIVNKVFPKAGPVIQLVLELIASLATFFTLLTVFVSGCLRLPIVLARVAGASEKADKIQAFHDKWIYWLKKLSMFNAPKLKK